MIYFNVYIISIKIAKHRPTQENFSSCQITNMIYVSYNNKHIANEYNWKVFRIIDLTIFLLFQIFIAFVLRIEKNSKHLFKSPKTSKRSPLWKMLEENPTPVIAPCLEQMLMALQRWILLHLRDVVLGVVNPPMEVLQMAHGCVLPSDFQFFLD